MGIPAISGHPEQILDELVAGFKFLLPGFSRPWGTSFGHFFSPPSSGISVLNCCNKGGRSFWTVFQTLAQSTLS
jgi:hypothetical protein